MEPSDNVRSTGLLVELRPLNAPSSLLPAVLSKLNIGYWYSAFPTVLGDVYVAFGPRGIVAIERADSTDDFEGDFERRFRHVVRRVDGLPPDLERQLVAALRRPQRDLALDLGSLTVFERSVLLKTLEIPRGEVRTYAWVAKEIGRPRAVRAVGTALATNPIPLVIPCHRVVRSDGRIGEYGCGGPEAKRLLLSVEGAHPDELEQLARRGVRFVGSDTTRVFCLPSCHGARRITDAHRVVFHSDSEALAAGFRACRSCRPVGAAA